MQEPYYIKKEFKLMKILDFRSFQRLSLKLELKELLKYFKISMDIETKKFYKT